MTMQNWCQDKDWFIHGTCYPIIIAFEITYYVYVPICLSFHLSGLESDCEFTYWTVQWEINLSFLNCSFFICKNRK